MTGNGRTVAGRVRFELRQVGSLCVTFAHYGSALNSSLATSSLSAAALENSLYEIPRSRIIKSSVDFEIEISCEIATQSCISSRYISGASSRSVIRSCV